MNLLNFLFIFCIQIEFLNKFIACDEEEQYVSSECSPLKHSDLIQTCIESYAGISSEQFLGFNDQSERYAVYTFRAGYFITHSDSVLFDCRTLAVYKSDIFICFDQNKTEFINLGEISQLICGTQLDAEMKNALDKCNLTYNVSFIANHNPTGNFRFLYDCENRCESSLINLFLGIFINFLIVY